MEIQHTQLALRFEEIQLIAVVTHMSLSEVWECSCDDAQGCLISMVVDHDDGTNPVSKETAEMAEDLIDRILLEMEKAVEYEQDAAAARWEAKTESANR